MAGNHTKTLLKCKSNGSFASARLALVKERLVSENRARSTENLDAKREVNRGVLVILS